MLPASRIERTRFLGLALLLASAIVVDLLSGNSLRYADEVEYDQLARSLLHIQTFAFSDGVPSVVRPPGYPAIISVIYVFCATPLAVKFLNAILLALSAALIGALAGRLDQRARAVVPFLALCYPLLLYAASLLYPQILGAFLLASTVYILTREHLMLRHAVASGLIYGLLILAIPSFLLLLPLFVLYILLRRNDSHVVSMRLSMVTIAAVALVLAPWTIRNYALFHVFVPVSANSGINLLLGNSPATTASNGVNDDVIRGCQLLHPGMNALQVDRAAKRCATEWIRQNPRAAVYLYFKKVANYFNYRNEITTASEAEQWRDWVMALTYYPLLIIAIIRVALFRRLPLTRADTLIYLLYFANAFASGIFFTRLRFRIPFDCLLLAVDAAFVVKCWDWSMNAYQARRNLWQHPAP